MVNIGKVIGIVRVSGFCRDFEVFEEFHLKFLMIIIILI